MFRRRSRRSKLFLVFLLGVPGCAPHGDVTASSRAASLTELTDTAEFAWVSIAGEGTEPFELSEGDADATDLIEDGNWEMGLGFASGDGETTTSIAYVRPVETWPVDDDPDRLSVASDDDVEDARIAQVVAGGLMDLIAEDVAEPDSVEEVLIGLPEVFVEPIDRTVARTIRENALLSDEYPALRLAATEAQYETILARQDEALAALAEIVELEVLEQFALANAALVRVARRDLRTLAFSDHIRRIEPNSAVDLLSINSEPAIEAAQIDQFLSRGETGGTPNPGRHAFPHVAIGFVDYAFEDDFDSLGDARVGARWNCHSSPCAMIADMNAPLEPYIPRVVVCSKHGDASRTRRESRQRRSSP